MTSFGSVIICLSLSFHMVMVKGFKCPSKESIFPCVCTQSGVIACTGEENKYLYYNLSKIFSVMSDELKEHEKHFNALSLTYAIADFTEHVMKDITFKTVRLNYCGHISFNKNAFTAATTTIESFGTTGTVDFGPDPSSLFQALSTLTHLRDIHIEHNSIVKIHDHAFVNDFGTQNQLQTIIITDYWRGKTQMRGSLRSIGNYAFYYIPHLTHFIAPHQNITVISPHAFSFLTPSEETLHINLAENLIKSLPIGVFTDAKRPLDIDLRSNKLTNLDQLTYEPILKADARNTIDIGDNIILCDCSVEWLIRDKTVYLPQIANGFCKNNKPLWEHTPRDFVKCHS